ncbi:MAG: hypothetical protein WA688_09285 [Thermoplasmata archaeon]
MSNLAASFPLFFFGAGCLAVAAFVLYEGSAATIGRIPLWIPFIALGAIALAGGTLSVFAEPDEASPTDAAQRTPPNPTAPVPRYIPPDRFPRSGTPTGAAPERVAARDTPTRPTDFAPPPARPPPASTPVEEPSPGPQIGAGLTAVLPDDTSDFLKELDLIEADLHAPRRTIRATPSVPAASAPTPTVAGSVFSTSTGPPAAKDDPPQLPVVGPSRLESEAPRRVVHCIGCGSAILHVGTPSQCQVCGEPLCSDCRDRSFSEGKPNLCPLCGLLDAVHSKGAAASRPPRARV